MMKHVLFFAAFGTLVACGGGKCDSNYTAKLEECGIEVPDVEGGEGEEVECTDELAEQVACMNDCTDAASCDAFDSTAEGYLDAVTAYGECTAACL